MSLIGIWLVGTLLTSLTLFHIVMGICSRNSRESVLTRDAIPAWNQARFYLLALVLTLVATEFGFLQRALDTESLSVNKWLICVGVALTLLVFEEVIKAYLRRKDPTVSVEVTTVAQPQEVELGMAR